MITDSSLKNLIISFNDSKFPLLLIKQNGVTNADDERTIERDVSFFSICIYF